MTSQPSDPVWIAPETPDLVWFRGTDHVRFLNDLISQEIADMVPGDARRSMLLGPEGKLEFILWVIRDDSGVGLLTEGGRGTELADRLGRYLIRVDVEVEAETEDRWIVVGRWQGYDVSWATVPRHLVIGPRPDLDLGSDEAYRALRISAGEPAWGLDVDEGTIPQESRLVDVSVDFDKGCFLGQELVARIESRGARPPRRLMMIVSEGPDLVEGGAVEAEGAEIGVVTSVAGPLGLGMVRRGTESGTAVVVGGVAGVVRDLPSKSQR